MGRPRFPRSTHEPKPRGECVVLVGPEGRGKDLLVASARRRFSADASLEFPQRIATRNSGANDEHLAVSRSAFRDLEQNGALFVSWGLGGHRFGLSTATAVALAEGRVVIFAASAEVADELARRNECVRVVEVVAGPDPLRARAAQLTPSIERAALDAAAPSITPAHHHRLHHGGDLAAAVRTFHDLILGWRLERLTQAPASRLLSHRRVTRLAAIVPPSARGPVRRQSHLRDLPARDR